MSAGTTAPVPYTWFAPNARTRSRPPPASAAATERRDRRHPRSARAWPASRRRVRSRRARRVDQLTEVTKGSSRHKVRVLSTSKAPSPVPALHALDPDDRAIHGGTCRLIGPPERDHDFRRVVDIRVVVVGELESPTGRPKIRAADGPVALDRDLLCKQIAGRGPKHWVARREPAVGKRRDRERSVPNRGLAGFDAPAGVVFDREAVETLDPRLITGCSSA